MVTQNGHLPAISVNNLEFAYPDGRAALRGVELSIQTGEKVAILGPNGAGKSTLLLHLNGLLHARGGGVTILGREVREDDKRGLQEIRALVGVVFQDPRRPALLAERPRRCGIWPHLHGLARR